jgi:hypothetical protein
VPAPAAAPSPKTSKVVVRSEPTGAAIFVDGKSVAITPAVLELELPKPVELHLAGYVTRREVLTGDATIGLTAVPSKKTIRPPRPARSASERPHEVGGGLD